MAVPGSPNNFKSQAMGEYIPPQGERDIYILVTGANRFVTKYCPGSPWASPDSVSPLIDPPQRARLFDMLSPCRRIPLFAPGR